MVFVSAWPEEKCQATQNKMTLNLNMGIIRRSCRSYPAFRSGPCWVEGWLVNYWEINLLRATDEMGFLSPFPVDAAENLGSLGLFLSVKEGGCLSGAGQDTLLTSPPGAWASAARAPHFRVGETAQRWTWKTLCGKGWIICNLGGIFLQIPGNLVEYT